MRLIDAEETIRYIEDVYCKECDSWNGVRCRACQIDDAIGCIDGMQTRAEPEKIVVREPVRTLGTWTEIVTESWSWSGKREYRYYMHSCGEKSVVKKKFCGGCGAKMKAD